MNVAKQLMRIEVAYDLISQVHTIVCNYTSRDSGIADMSLETLQQIMMLYKRIEREQQQ